MKKETHEYLIHEFNYFQKQSEIQFEHFMKVFVFWTTIVTAPLTIGLLSKNGKLGSLEFGILLFLIGLIGFFLALKIFDIRCSQLRYIAKVNQIRDLLYSQLNDEKLLALYQSVLPPDNNLQDSANKDFGRSMANIMSFIHGVFIGFSFLIIVPHFFQYIKINFVCLVLIGFLVGILVYIIGVEWYKSMVKDKVPSPNSYIPKR